MNKFTYNKIFIPFTLGNIAHAKGSHKTTSMDVVKRKMMHLQKIMNHKVTIGI